MLFAWLGARGFLGLAKGLWLLGAVVLLIGAVAWLKSRETADDKANVEIGRAIEREEALTETIERVETANEAREEIGRPDAAGDRLRYDQCLRTARTPANCERFLPDRQAD